MTAEVYQGHLQESDVVKDSIDKLSTVMSERLDKFSDVMQSVDRNITSLFTEALKANALQKEEFERQRTNEQFDKLKNREDESKRKAEEAKNKVSKVNRDSSLGLSAFLGLAAGAGGRIAAMGAGAASLGGKALMTGLVLGLTPFVGQFTKDFVAQSMLNFEFSPGTAASFGDAAGLASMGGMLGLAFGKRFGLIAAAAGAAYTFGDEVLSAMGIDQEYMINAFGMELRAQDAIGGVMSAMVTVAGAALTSPAAWSKIGSLAMSSAGFLLKMAATRLSIVTAIGSLYMAYGDDASAYLQEQGMSEGFANLAVDIGSFTTMGAVLGSKFGVVGIIVGAIAGFALGVGKGFSDWIDRERDAKIKEVIDDYDASMKQYGDSKGLAKAAITNPMSDAVNAGSASHIQSEIIRLGATPETIANMQETISKGEEVDKNVVQGIVLKGITTPDEAAKLISSAIISDEEIKAAAEKLRETGAFGIDGTDYISTFVEQLIKKYPQLMRLSREEFLEALSKTNEYVLDPKGKNGASYAIDWGYVFPEDQLRAIYDKMTNTNLDINKGINTKVDALIAAGEDKRGGATTVVNAPVTTNNNNVTHGGNNTSASTIVGGGRDGGDTTFKHLPVH